MQLEEEASSLRGEVTAAHQQAAEVSGRMAEQEQRWQGLHSQMQQKHAAEVSGHAWEGEKHRAHGKAGAAVMWAAWAAACRVANLQ